MTSIPPASTPRPPRRPPQTMDEKILFELQAIRLQLKASALDAQERFLAERAARLAPPTVRSMPAETVMMGWSVEELRRLYRLLYGDGTAACMSQEAQYFLRKIKPFAYPGHQP